jgi:uncharacterized membrane protein YhhN
VHPFSRESVFGGARDIRCDTLGSAQTTCHRSAHVDAPQLGLLTALAVFVVLHLLVERRTPGGEPSGPSFWLTKGAASACFVALGVISRAAAPMMIALALAFGGDLLLVPKDARVFRAGIVVFLLAHISLSVAFVLLGDESWTRVSFAIPLLIVAAFTVARALLPRVPPTLRAAVVAYMIVISGMVALAAGAGWLVVPALAFYANDLLVARDRFVEKRFWHRAVGLPLYYGAMAAFASS